MADKKRQFKSPDGRVHETANAVYANRLLSLGYAEVKPASKSAAPSPAPAPKPEAAPEKGQK